MTMEGSGWRLGACRDAAEPHSQPGRSTERAAVAGAAAAAVAGAVAAAAAVAGAAAGAGAAAVNGAAITLVKISPISAGSPVGTPPTRE
jgi:hypothetical protein